MKMCKTETTGVEKPLSQDLPFIIRVILSDIILFYMYTFSKNEVISSV